MYCSLSPRSFSSFCVKTRFIHPLLFSSFPVVSYFTPLIWLWKDMVVLQFLLKPCSACSILPSSSRFASYHCFLRLFSLGVLFPSVISDNAVVGSCYLPAQLLFSLYVFFSPLCLYSLYTIYVSSLFLQVCFRASLWRGYVSIKSLNSYIIIYLIFSWYFFTSSPSYLLFLPLFFIVISASVILSRVKPLHIHFSFLFTFPPSFCVQLLHIFIFSHHFFLLMSNFLASFWLPSEMFRLLSC